MRTTWNGSLTFGLVSIPVGLAPATKPAARQSDVSFRLLHRECLTPIKQKRWCPVHDRELAPDEIVKGWEASKGNFVVVEEAELEALEAHDDSRSIEISKFVDVGQVDPIWRDRVYYLVPGSTAAQRRPYRLLLEAKLGGQELPPPSEPEPPQAPAGDLLAALKASVEAAKSGEKAKPAAKARKPAAKSRAKAS